MCAWCAKNLSDKQNVTPDTPNKLTNEWTNKHHPWSRWTFVQYLGNHVKEVDLTGSHTMRELTGKTTFQQKKYSSKVEGGGEGWKKGRKGVRDSKKGETQGDIYRCEWTKANICGLPTHTLANKHTQTCAMNKKIVQWLRVWKHERLTNDFRR